LLSHGLQTQNKSSREEKASDSGWRGYKEKTGRQEEGERQTEDIGITGPREDRTR